MPVYFGFDGSGGTLRFTCCVSADRDDLPSVVANASALPHQHLHRVVGSGGVLLHHGMPVTAVRAVEFVAAGTLSTTCGTSYFRSQRNAG